MTRQRLIHGDALRTLRTFKDNSVDAIVTDPPYGLKFMGEDWDSPTTLEGHLATGHEKRQFFAYGGTHEHGYGDVNKVLYQKWCTAWGHEALRILKPGGHLLSFGATRMYHRLASGLEDAGFEIADSIMWLYGQGMPKSHDISKAIDKQAGVEREDLGPGQWMHVKAGGTWGGNVYGGEPSHGKGPRETAPATPEAKQWNGWGTALKPAHEPIVVARKYREGTFASNVLEYSVGGVNIDGCRIPHGEDVDLSAVQRQSAKNPLNIGGAKPGDVIQMFKPGGRWPANLILDEHSAEMIDAQQPNGSRFFYIAKASASEKNAGLPKGRKNKHPTVKPVALMRWLIRLVCPPGSLLIDPFVGSGTTLVAAHLEGIGAIGIDNNAVYLKNAMYRAKYAGARVRYMDPRPQIVFKVNRRPA